MAVTRANIRQLHSYIGLFIAPSVLFFALTGVVQLYGLHEAHGSYTPPVIVEKLSSVHKDQVFALGDHHPKPTGDDDKTDRPPTGKPDVDADESSLSAGFLKGFFLVVAACLVLSTCFGVWMGLTQTRRRGLAYSLVILGAIVPLAALIF